jgi:hypothetical protein
LEHRAGWSGPTITGVPTIRTAPFLFDTQALMVLSGPTMSATANEVIPRVRPRAKPPTPIRTVLRTGTPYVGEQQENAKLGAWPGGGLSGYSDPYGLEVRGS